MMNILLMMATEIGDSGVYHIPLTQFSWRQSTLKLAVHRLMA